MAEKIAVKTDEKKTDLQKALDGALLDLQKAAGGDDLTKGGDKCEKCKKEHSGDCEKENLVDNPPSKGEGAGSKGKDAPWKGGAGKGDGDEKKSGKGSAESQDGKGDEEEHARTEGFRKSVADDLTKGEAVKNAVEVSKFLGEIVKSLAEFSGDLKATVLSQSKRIDALEKSNAVLADALVKSFGTNTEIVKSLADEIGTLGGRPRPRISVPANKVAILEKSQRGDEAAGGTTLSKSQIASKIADLELAGKAPRDAAAKFEATGEMIKSVEEMVFGKAE